MRDNSRDFWRLSSRSILVLVAIYGPLLAAYGLAIRVILGIDRAGDHTVGVVTAATFVSGGIAVVYAVLLSYGRRKTGNGEDRDHDPEDASGD